MSNALDQLEQQLERSIENVRQIRIIVSNFQPQGQPALNQKLQTIVKDLQEIDKLRPKLNDIQVPLEVFDYIDSGRNPQLYTKDCMEKAVAKNEEVKGKIDAYRAFKARLLVELHQVFPKEMGYYRATRGEERATGPNLPSVPNN
ncbi:mediator of RNA polymerase II transcription subunit 10 [Lepeophtheirus salmonis]|uniref:mediator of RNA polymerase II transcription subunit 10 n=1 Tax=Lepeophtheirus salmonis TaxID=72036 RepID=UPI001AE85B5A|nr:mediator of RNA polymerase II transcription subunit 10-like [Lepeophtheirus salmonis]